MRGLFWILALFACAVGVSLVAHVNEGYVLLVLPPYRAEVSLNLAIAGLLAAFVVFYFFLRGAALTLSLPRRVRQFRARRQQDKRFARVGAAIRLICEGRFSQALKKAGEAYDASHASAQACLLAARAAQLLREPEKQKEWLERALLADRSTEAACLMLEAEALVSERRYEEAVAVLRHLHKSAGKHVAALRLELRAQQGCGDWDESLRIARVLEKRGALPLEVTREIKIRAHEENVRRYRDDLVTLLAYVSRIPAAEHAPALSRLIAEAMITAGAHAEAAAFIKARLEESWDSDLAGLFGKVGGDDATTRIALADRWLAEHHDDPQLLLALGRLCSEQRLWGKAQNYLEAALSVAETDAARREARLALARLLEETDRAAEALPHYRAAAMLGEKLR